MDKVLIIDGDRCTGCKVCELICSMHKTGEYNTQQSCIRVLRNMELDVSVPAISTACDNCGKCVDWCFEKAIRFVSYPEAAILRKQAKIGCFPAPFVSYG